MNIRELIPSLKVRAKAKNKAEKPANPLSLGATTYTRNASAKTRVNYEKRKTIKEKGKPAMNDHDQTSS